MRQNGIDNSNGSFFGQHFSSNQVWPDTSLRESTVRPSATIHGFIAIFVIFPADQIVKL